MFDMVKHGGSAVIDFPSNSASPVDKDFKSGTQLPNRGKYITDIELPRMIVAIDISSTIRERARQTYETPTNKLAETWSPPSAEAGVPCPVDVGCHRYAAGLGATRPLPCVRECRQNTLGWKLSRIGHGLSAGRTRLSRPLARLTSTVAF